MAADYCLPPVILRFVLYYKCEKMLKIRPLMHFLPPQPHQFSIVGNRVKSNGSWNWILKSLMAAALTHTWHVSAWGDHTCQGVTCIILTGELIGPISSCLGPAATCRGLECDISTTYYWDVLHFIITYHITVAIIRIYFHDLHKINKNFESQFSHFEVFIFTQVYLGIKTFTVFAKLFAD